MTSPRAVSPIDPVILRCRLALALADTADRLRAYDRILAAYGKHRTDQAWAAASAELLEADQ